MEYTVDKYPHMETIQIVIDSKLLEQADRVVRRTKINRSALIRDALRQHLKRLTILEKEESDRRGYEKQPVDDNEAFYWASEAHWPKV